MKKQEVSDSQKRVQNRYKAWQEARKNLDAFISENEDIHKELERLADACNAAKSRFEDACRETGIGYGPISVVERSQPVFDGKYIYELLEDKPSIRNAVVEVVYKVNRSTLEQYISEGVINKKQANKALVEVKTTKALNGVPTTIIYG